MKIDQDELCAHCDCDESRCEGSGCAEAEISYMKDHGLVDSSDVQTFRDIDIDDSLYLITDDILEKTKVISIEKIKTGITFTLEKSEKVTVEINKALYYSAPTDPISTGLYIEKAVAVADYEKIMAEKIIKMARILAKFEKAD